MDISAYAFHIDAGVTLPVAMQPRLGAEFNTASGQKNSNTCRALQDLNDPGDAAQCPGTWSGFDQLYPTNHIHFGYMDLMSWKNMKPIPFGLQLRPAKNSHFEITGHKFYLNELTDHWYFASQGYAAFQDTLHGNDTNDLGSEGMGGHVHVLQHRCHDDITYLRGRRMVLVGIHTDGQVPAFCGSLE